jgi:hypothetical protein
LPWATVAWLQSHIQSSKQENVIINASKAAKKVLSACRLHKLINKLAGDMMLQYLHIL